MAGETHRFVLNAPYVVEPDKIPEALTDVIGDGRCILFLGAG